MNDIPATSGPVGMASTPIGTVFLYEMGAGDVAEYGRQPYDDPRERVRWLLTRVASKSSAGDGRERPAMLTREEVGALGDAEVDELAETFLASPGNQWHVRRSADSRALEPRGDGESPALHLDRLVRWRATLPAEAPAPRRGEQGVFAPAAPARNPDAATRQLLTWVSAGLALTVLLSAAALAFAALSYFDARADHAANELWRGEMRRLQDAKPAESSKVVSELAAENARLRYRLELVEGKLRSSSRTAAAPAPAKAATRTSSKSSQGRSGKQAR